MEDIQQETPNNYPTEERFIANDVSWEQYEALLLKLGDNSSYRVTYLDGVLEILSQNRRHEGVKKRIGTLLEVYFEESKTEYFPPDSKTLRRQERRGGTEPDQSYCIGTEKFPNLAIEVLLTTGQIDKLAMYKRLEVKEVWFWKNRQFSLYQWRTNEYEPITKSEILPNLDVMLLTKYVNYPNPLSVTVQDFRQQIKQLIQ